MTIFIETKLALQIALAAPPKIAAPPSNPVVDFFVAVGWIALVFFGCYAVIMAGMCLAGWLLAKRTQVVLDADILERPAEDMIVDGRVARTEREFFLGRWYLGVLLAALVLFYLALPVVFAGLLIVFAFLAVATVFSKDGQEDRLLHSTGGGIKGVWKAAFARTGTGSFGVRKNRRQCPRLFAAIDEVADRVGTDPPDEVWIAPGADFCVHQEGRGPFGAFGARKRVLTVGLCVMNYLSISEFKSILAHEFAHFSHADTAWSRFTFQVTLSQRIVRKEMARAGGWVTYVNPFYLFFWGFGKSYDLLSAGFSRSREFLADRMACVLYGSDVFAQALEKVCTDGVHFERVIRKNIVHHLRNGQAFVNMYHAFRQHRLQILTPEARQKFHRELLDRAPSFFDSHPTFEQRLRAGKMLPAASFTEETSAMTLFGDADKTEKELTDFLTHVVADRAGY